MKLFHTTQKLSCIILGMGVMASAHAVSCGDTITMNTTLDTDLECSTGDWAIRIMDNGIKFNLDDHSITKVGAGSDPEVGILITGDNDEVKGPGTVSGFIRNVFIEDGNDNRVSKLNIDGGFLGVVIGTKLGPQANGNHISDNVISNMQGLGIALTNDSIANTDVSGNHVYDNDIKNIAVGSGPKGGIAINSDTDGRTNNNQIYRNHIENISSPNDQASGIAIFSGDPGSIAENNRVVNNTIKGVSGDDINVAGIIVTAITSSSSANLNWIALNKIEDTRYGIVIRARATSEANQNAVFLNHITRPGAEAIALQPFDFDDGSVFLNSVTWNFAQEVTGQAYCDSSGVFNNWGFNTDDLSPLFFAPGDCL